ncbi:hypothetical protein N9174_00705 [bacterium]|nr:hypothetical protein [bacterium]
MKRMARFVVPCVLVVLLALTAFPSLGVCADKPETELMLLGGRVGDPWYAISQGLASFVNRGSSWLRLDVVAAPGVDSGPEIAKEKPDKYLYIMSDLALKYMPKMKKYNYYDKMRFIGLSATTTEIWVTYDKDIRKAEDLVGKRVFIGRPGGLRVLEEKAILEALGLIDKIKLSQGGFGGGLTALKDGLADVAIMLLDHVYPTSYKKSSLIQELETKKPIYYPNIMPKEFQEKLGLIPGRVPPGTLDPKTQPEEVWATVLPIYFAADVRMSEDVVYETTRILYENAGKFTQWHAQGESLTKEYIPVYVYDKQWVHPGAMKYYNENNIEVRDLSKLLH